MPAMKILVKALSNEQYNEPRKYKKLRKLPGRHCNDHSIACRVVPVMKLARYVLPDAQYPVEVPFVIEIAGLINSHNFCPF